jgi:pimeloyl-ACP methyl ester carboxylesterase
MNFARTSARIVDGAMCAMMFAIQQRHRLTRHSRKQFEEYIAAHEGLSREAYFAAPAVELPAGSAAAPFLEWQSPITTGFRANDRVHMDLFPCARGWTHPTVIFLHALMSASDIGYRRWAARFNEHGWNACFVHLPFHYSRTPRGRFNGELAITPDVVRTAEGLRQGVSEVRQLLGVLRTWGCREFGVMSLSYGGWIGGLLASVEPDFRWIGLLEPIVDVDHAIWIAPVGLALRRELRRVGVEAELIARHFPLESPMHGSPLNSAKRVIFCAGEYDQIARLEDVQRLHELWHGSEMLRLPQGHFGYGMMRAACNRLQEKGWI